MKQFTLLLVIVVSVCATANAQMNVGSTKAPDSSAMLQISGNTKGFLPPRMSRDSMYLIAKPARGLLVFNTTDSLLFMRRDTGWVALTAGEQVWQKNGNAIYNKNSGFVGIGTTNPSTMLHVAGANPLTLLGVADGTNTSTDSLLTITNGLVRKLPLSSFALASDQLSSATAPLVYSGNVISINQASTTDDGYLSASDYNIFNSKVSSISLTANPLYPTTSFGITGGAATATLSLNTQVKNRVFAGPVSGANAQPTFRALVPADMPIATTSTLGAVSVGTGLSVTAAGVLSATNTSSGSVTSVSVSSANGLAGTVATNTTTPAITLSTTVTGMVKGNGTALSAATSGTDYAPGTASNTTGIVKSTTGTGALTTATASDFPTLNQNTTGTAANITGVLNATSHPALTGDVTTPSGSVVTTISNSAVTNAKMANMAANTFKANNTASAAAPSDITGTQATAMLDAFTSTTKGLVPASGGGTTNFLRADGTFAAPPSAGSGTVTSVSVTNVNGVSGTVATSTTTPAISLTLADITPTSVTSSGDISTQGTMYVDKGNNNTGTKSPGLIFGGGSSGEGISSNRSGSGSTGGFGLNFYTNNINRMSILQSGYVGIGTALPAYKLQVLSSNVDPLYLGGVNTGTSTSADSLLTITSGVVKKIPMSTFSSPTNSWSVSGNSGTTSASNFLGTTDLRSLAFRTNNTQRLFLDSAGNVSIGASPVFATSPEKLLVDAGTTQSFNVISGKGTINNYLQLNIQNKSTGATASSDVVATADNGDENSNYVDLGINGSGNNSGSFFGVANDAYLYTQGQNLLIGTATAAKSVAFLTGGGTQSSNERMRIDGNGNVGIGISAPTAKLHIVGTNPLTLMGVQAGANTDSILTIASGVVRKLPFSTVSSGSGSSGSSGWSLTGNSGTSSSNFLGTTDNNPLLIKINNQPSGRLDAVNTYLGYNSGYNNGTNANQNTGIGYHAAFSNTSGSNNTALGYNSLPNNATGSYNIGIGYNADVVNNSSYSILMGANSTANQSNSIAIGNSSQTNNTNALSIGNYAYTNGNYGISIGNGSASYKTQGAGDYSTAIGYNATANTTNTIAIGTGTNSGGTNAITIGNAAAASASNSVAIGNNASATVANTIVLGDKSNTDVSVAIGPESFTSGAREKLLVDAGTSPSFNIISAKGNYNNYMQLNVQNRSNGGNASSDLVATCNDGDESNNYVDLGINSSGNSSGQWGSAYDAYLYSQTSNMLIGTAGNSKSVAFLTGGGSQSSNERMRIDGSGNVGIGTSAPTAKLHVVGTNPLTLMGVQTGTSTSADSLLTITTGVVKKIPMTAFPSPGSDWSVTGNSNAPSGTAFMGTSYNMGVKFRTNNTQLMLLDSLGNVAIGSSPSQTSGNVEKLLVDAGNTNSFNVISGKGSTNNYLQLNIQNRSSGGQASSDIVATADNGDESNNYVDLGINGSGNNSANFFGGANDAYLYAQTQNILIGTANANRSIMFMAGGGKAENERMRILSSGNVGIGTTAPTATLQLKAGTATAGTAPLKLTQGVNMSSPEAGAVEFDGTNYFVTSSNVRYTMAKTLTATASLDFPSTTAGSSSTLTITVNGAADGDVVSLGTPIAVAGVSGAFTAYVSATNTVTVKFQTGVTENPSAGTFRVSVLKY